MSVGKLAMCSPIGKITSRTEIRDLADLAWCYGTLLGKFHLTRVQGKTDLDPLDKLESNTICFHSPGIFSEPPTYCQALHTPFGGAKQVQIARLVFTQQELGVECLSCRFCHCNWTITVTESTVNLTELKQYCRTSRAPVQICRSTHIEV